MPVKLVELMRQRAADLADTVERRLKKSGAQHYRKLDESLLHGRAVRFVEAFIESVGEGPEPLVAYIQQITEDRISEGFFLDEIQRAFSIIEEKAWQIVVEHTPLEDQVRRLSRITGIVGAAKDRLAHIYMDYKERAESRVSRLEKRLNELFKGTVASPDLEDEDLPDPDRKG